MEKKLTIGIDASRSNVDQKTGTEYYSYEIIKNIVSLENHNYRLYSKTPINYLEKGENVQNKVMRFPRLWSQVRLSYEIYKNPPDVLFEPAHTIPLYHGKNTVITLHDVGFRYYPELYTPLERYYHHTFMKFSVKHATRIISISEATKKDLISLYGADKDKIEVIYHGYDKAKYYPLNKSEQSPDWLIELKPYIYFIGRIEAKKNIVNMVKSYGKLRKNDDKIKHKLVLAGRPGYLYEDVKKEIESLPKHIREDIVELGYVEDEKVSNLMRHANIFFFPSRFEGFGMPLVEAMASGVPIVASSSTSIPEIAGHAALLNDPDDVDGFAKSLNTLINNSKTKQDLISKGLDRSKMFSWKDAAKKTLDVLTDAAS